MAATFWTRGAFEAPRSLRRRCQVRARRAVAGESSVVCTRATQSTAGRRRTRWPAHREEARRERYARRRRVTEAGARVGAVRPRRFLRAGRVRRVVRAFLAWGAAL